MFNNKWLINWLRKSGVDTFTAHITRVTPWVDDALMDRPMKPRRTVFPSKRVNPRESELNDLDASLPSQDVLQPSSSCIAGTDSHHPTTTRLCTAFLLYLRLSTSVIGSHVAQRESQGVRGQIMVRFSFNITSRQISLNHIHFRSRWLRAWKGECECRSSNNSLHRWSNPWRSSAERAALCHAGWIANALRDGLEWCSLDLIEVAIGRASRSLGSSWQRTRRTASETSRHRDKAEESRGFPFCPAREGSITCSIVVFASIECW